MNLLLFARVETNNFRFPNNVVFIKAWVVVNWLLLGHKWFGLGLLLFENLFHCTRFWRLVYFTTDYLWLVWVDIIFIVAGVIVNFLSWFVGRNFHAVIIVVGI